jgi:site-specific DNA-methyltransferase (adenine-specific)
MFMQNQLYYGDNLEVLQNSIPDESVDLCYIDPPFNSKRDYNQIYNNIGKDFAQATAFTDTWEWDNEAIRGFARFDLVNGDKKIPDKTKILINSLYKICGECSMLAYLVSIAQRVVEIHRVLKPTGSFYLHCDPTASHYLKLVLDSIFEKQGGEFRNEISWHYSGWNKRLARHFERRHDIIFFYSKRKNNKFNSYAIPWEDEETYIKKRKQKVYEDEQGKYVMSDGGNGKRVKRYIKEAMAYGSPIDDVWEIDKINNSSKERLGYPTQKPEELLERIILASSNEGDVVLDAYCGCGTTVAVAERFKRKWIGIDITYQSIYVILQRLENHFGKKILDKIELSGIPKDIASAVALAHKENDKTRKEFEKWAVITYSNEKAIPNEQKGADKGLDGRLRFIWNFDREIKEVLFLVKSGKVGVSQIRDFLHVIDREKDAAAGVFITLEEPTKSMLQEAKNAGAVTIPLTWQAIEKLQIVTIQQILDGAKANFPLAIDPLKTAERKIEDKQVKMNI